jgi:hypothetical protein
MWPKSYARDLERAWARIRATRSEIVNTPWGDIEYATEGAGRPVLMSHGIFGSHVEARRSQHQTACRWTSTSE